MWCRHCQQETPAKGPVTEYGMRCARCERTSEQASPEPRSEAHAEEMPLGASEHRSAERLIRRTLHTARVTASSGPASRTFRFDTGTLGVAKPLTASSTTQREATASRTFRPRQHQAASPSQRPASRLGQWAGWVLAATGSLTLGIGVGLLGWSTLGDRPDLWNHALATAAFGQGMVIIGLVQLLANLWAASRKSAAKLAQMHDDLRRVRRTTEQTAGQQAPTAAAFYSGLATSASPDVLMGNLRGQLDQLSARLRSE